MRFPDSEVLKQATSQSRILLTLNRKHFVHLHEQSADHYGILVCTVDPDFIGLAGRIHDVVSQIAESKAKLIRINRPG